MALFLGTITLSGNLDYFENQGAFFVYHNLFGYILGMSRDLIDFLEYFRGRRRSPEEVIEHFRGTFDTENLEQFVEVFMNQGCLVPEFASEEGVALEMVPVRARWSTYHMPAEGPVTLYSAHRDENLVDVIELDSWDSAFWRAVDGEKKLAAIIEELREHPESPTVGLEQKVLATLSKLTHGSAQFLKLSPKAMSEFGKGHNARPMPPYLKSTMPYRRVTDELRGDKSVHVGFEAVKEVAVTADSLGREGFEATLAHLFRRPRPALGGRSYGGALAHCIGTKGHLKAGSKVLEAGALTGDLMAGFLDQVKEGWPEAYQALEVTVLTPDEDRIAAIGARIEAAGHRATVVAGDVVSLGGLEGPYDVIVSDETMANFETTLLRKVTLGDEEDEEEARPADRDPGADEAAGALAAEEGEAETREVAAEPEEQAQGVEAPGEPAEQQEEAQGVDASGEQGGEGASSEEPRPEQKPAKSRNGRPRGRDIYLGQGDSVSVVFKHNLTFHDVDGEFLFNIGAVNFVDAVAAALSSGGIAVLIEYGELFEYPEPSSNAATEGLHSIRFQTLQDVGRSLGLRAEFDWVINYLGFDTGRQMLATTQHQFRALRVLLERHGVTLDNQAYSRADWDALLATANLPAESLPELEFRSLNDRVMGVVPAGIKLIELSRDAASDESGGDE